MRKIYEISTFLIWPLATLAFVPPSWATDPQVVLDDMKSAADHYAEKSQMATALIYDANKLAADNKDAHRPNETRFDATKAFTSLMKVHQKYSYADHGNAKKLAEKKEPEFLYPISLSHFVQEHSERNQALSKISQRMIGNTEKAAAQNAPGSSTEQPDRKLNVNYSRDHDQKNARQSMRKSVNNY